MPDIESLRNMLESSDAEDRREAVVDLGRVGLSAAPLLLHALGDQDWRVRKTAVVALVLMADSDVIAGLIGLLGAHDNAGARNSAIEALVQIGEQSVDALLPVLTTPDPDVRKFAVDTLGDIRSPRAVPELISRLEDQDENVSVASAEALGKIGDPRAVDALLACLVQHDRGWLDCAAAEALGELGDVRALGPLLAALDKSNLREPVIGSLGKIGNVSTLGPLIAGLADPLRLVREVSASAIAAIYAKSASEDCATIIQTVRSAASDEAVRYLEEILLSSTGSLRRAVIALLGWKGRKSSISKVLDLLNEEELEEPVVQSLSHLAPERADFLFPYLESSSALVRRTVVRVLSEIGSAKAESSLIMLLTDGDGHVRSSAAAALGRLRSRRAVGPLLSLMADEYESVQMSAIDALAAIGDESVLDRTIPDFSSREPSMRRNIVLLFGKFMTDAAVEALAFALKDEEPDVRKAVVQALGRVADDKTLRALLLAITDDDAEVRMLAAEALGRTNTGEARDALIPLLEDSDLWVRATAARGLGVLGDEGAAAVLAEHLGSAEDIFLLALIEALGMLVYEPAVGQLVTLANHTDPEVRKTVIAALDAFEGEAVRQALTARLSDPHWSVRKRTIESISRRPDADAGAMLSAIAAHDPDDAVRQAAKEALRK